MLRKRVTLIIKTKEGILIGKHIFNWNYALLGGGVKFGESDLDVVRRELKEETNLGCKKIKYLFEFNCGLHKHKVFLVEPKGEIKFNWEIREHGFVDRENYRGAKLRKFSRMVLERYFNIYLPPLDK